MTEAYVRARSRLHLARFDQLNAERCQTNALLGLVHRARNTQFGLHHDFHRIRTETDYRRLVPVTNSALLSRTYWQPACPHFTGTTWPGRLLGLANFDLTDSGPRQILLSNAYFASQQRAYQTALAFAFAAHPHKQLLSGSLLFLGEAFTLTAMKAAAKRETLMREGLLALLRPYSLTELGGAGQAETDLDALAIRSSQQPLTCVCGSLADLTRLFDRVKAVTQREKVAHVWPRLLAVLYSGRPEERGLLASLRDELGPRITLLEVGRFPEGVAAVEDPRHNLLRLLPNHGLYYEFIPAEEIANHAPTRVGLADVQVGATYELVLTSPAGGWACRSGAAVCFERLAPVLLRFVAMPCVQPLPAKREATVATVKESPPHDLKGPAPHRRNAGTPAELPESFGHNPWLVPVDRK